MKGFRFITASGLDIYIADRNKIILVANSDDPRNKTNLFLPEDDYSFWVIAKPIDELIKELEA